MRCARSSGTSYFFGDVAERILDPELVLRRDAEVEDQRRLIDERRVGDDAAVLRVLERDLPVLVRNVGVEPREARAR
jgi:hypothetical protein